LRILGKTLVDHYVLGMFGGWQVTLVTDGVVVPAVLSFCVIGRLLLVQPSLSTAAAFTFKGLCQKMNIF
jgi:hypothetical protein